MKKIKAALCALVCAVMTMPLFAASYVVAPDEVFVGKSDAVVLARTVRSYVQESSVSGIETVTEFEVAETLLGAPRTTVSIHIPGGALNGRVKVIGGAPSFNTGEEYLLFLNDTSVTREPMLTDFGLGVFAFSDQGGRRTVQRSGEVFGWNLDGTVHEEHARDAAAFLDYIRAYGRGERNTAKTYELPPSAATSSDRSSRTRAHVTATYNGSSYTVALGVTSGGCPTDGVGCGGRWNVFPTQVNWNQGNTEAGAAGTPAGSTAIQAGIAAWNGAGAGIKYALTTSNPNANGIAENADGINNVVFDKVIAGVSAYNCASGGTLGIGGIQNGSGFNTKNGEQYVTILEGDVSMNQGLANCSYSASTNFNTAVAHELGHSLGFRHSDQDRNNGACNSAIMECTSSAIMNHSIVGGLNAVTQTWDKNAAAMVYGSGAPTCTAPAVTTQPSGSTITAGNQASLTVAASGTATLTYQWYVGTSGNISSPVPGGTTATIQVSPTTTTQYWARVTNSCGTADSNAATITVTAPCAAPQITGQPQSTQINAGASANLAVSTNGTGYTYQWYIGSSGNIGNPVPGGNGPSVSVSPASTTSYWVQVTNPCSPTAQTNSVTVVVTVITNGCAAIQILVQPQSKVITSGQSATLSVSAQSTATPLTYQWYVGTAGDTSAPIPGATNFSVQVSPTTNTIYWVQITNACRNTANSFQVQVTVNPPGCPTITMNTPTITQNGSSYTLTASPSGGTGLTVSWFIQGSSVPLGSGLQFTVTPTQTTTYVARASNSCGGQLDVPVTITITPPGAQCTAPTIVSVSPDVTLPPGASTTLIVAATSTGGALHYQWYLGTAGTTTTTVGTDAASFTTGPVTETTPYWVKVTNDCGTANGTASTNSTTITVTAQPARRRAAHH